MNYSDFPAGPPGPNRPKPPPLSDAIEHHPNPTGLGRLSDNLPIKNTFIQFPTMHPSPAAVRRDAPNTTPAMMASHIASSLRMAAYGDGEPSPSPQHAHPRASAPLMSPYSSHATPSPVDIAHEAREAAYHMSGAVAWPDAPSTDPYLQPLNGGLGSNHLAGLPQTIAEESSHYGQDYMNHRNVPLGAGMPAHDPSLQQQYQMPYNAGGSYTDPNMYGGPPSYGHQQSQQKGVLGAPPPTGGYYTNDAAYYNDGYGHDMMGGPPHGYNSYQGPMDKYGDQYGGHQMRGNNRNMNNGPPPPTYQGGGGGYMNMQQRGSDFHQMHGGPMQQQNLNNRMSSPKREKTVRKKAHAKVRAAPGTQPASVDSRQLVMPAGLADGNGTVTEPPTMHQQVPQPADSSAPEGREGGDWPNTVARAMGPKNPPTTRSRTMPKSFQK